MKWEDENVAENKKSSNETCLNDLQMLFNASKLIKNNKKSKPAFETSWPPLAAVITNENLENVVGPVLFK